MTYWNKYAWWISVPVFSLLSIIIILLLSNVSLPCQQVGYNINQTQTHMSVTPIELDRAKYAVGQIVHISQIQNNSDTKNVKKSPEYSVTRIDNISQIQNNSDTKNVKKSPEYSVEHIVNIYQIPNDSAGENVKEYLEINRTHYPHGIPGCYKPFTPPQEQDTFALIELDNLRSNYTFIPNQPGLYVISTFKDLQQKEFKTIFEVINPIKSATFIMLIIAIGFFIALVFLTFILSKKNRILNNKKIKELEEKIDIKTQIDKFRSLSLPELVQYMLGVEYLKRGLEEQYQRKIEEKYHRKMLDYIEIASSLRYLFISALVWSIILALVFTEVEIGTHSPLGLVIRHNLNPESGELDVTKNPLIEWGINIGGNWENNFSSGVVIPVYVLILGLIGGYLRYLHKAASKEKVFSRVSIDKTKEKNEGEEGIKKEYIKKSGKPLEDTSSEFLETTYGELSNIFLAPLLAAVVWFIISQGQTDFNIYGMAAISFSIGLVTTEIIQLIVKFMERIIPAEKSNN